MAHWLVIVCCLSIAFSTSFGQYICPDGWNLMPGGRHQCIQVFVANVTWSGARMACETQASRLAIVRNAFENAFIQHEMSLQNFGDMWLGGITATPAPGDVNDWFWEDGTTDFQSYMNWDSGQPDAYEDCGPNYLEACLEMRSNGKWDDNCCAYHDGYVKGYACSMDAEQS
uniref:C-type lectin domain-containing protein n=1 Tax=Plectus sambesii TaxID=2011161 RepID=A0A914WS75_9BILA